MLDKFFHSDKTYYSGYESFCDLNSIRLILEAGNVKHPDLYMDSSLNLRINPHSELEQYNIALHELTKRRSVVPEYINKVKKHYYPDGIDAREMYELNLNKINEDGMPIAVGADIYYLPYNTQEYAGTHGWHTLTICGNRVTDGSVYVVDWSEPWFYKGLITKADFLLARSSDNTYNGDIYSGLPIQNYWIEVDTNGWDKTPMVLFSIILELTIKQYFTPTDDPYVGLTGLHNLMNYLSSVDAIEADIDKGIFKHLHRKLYIALKRHKLFRQFLQNISRHTKIQGIENVIGNIDDILIIWEIILVLILKISIVGPTSMTGVLTKHFESVLSKEKRLGDKLAKMLAVYTGF